MDGHLLLTLAQTPGSTSNLNDPVAGSTNSTLQGETPIEVANAFVQRLDILTRPTELMDTLAHMHVVWASVLLVVGILCVMNGYRWHKPVVVICAFLSGLALGRMLSRHMGESHIIMAALGLLFAVIATPLLRYAVAVFGGITGAVIGANLWTVISTSPDAHVAGAAMGFIAVGMASFVLFKFVVMLFTSIGGSAMAVLGGITLLLHVPAWEESVRNALSANNLLIPMLVATAAVTGFVLQQSTTCSSQSSSGGRKSGGASPRPASA